MPWGPYREQDKGGIACVQVKDKDKPMVLWIPFQTAPQTYTYMAM